MIEELTAYRTVERSMSLGSATPERITTAETTASMFRVVQVPPVLGRPLLETDEQPGAPPVVVLGYDVWQRRFAGRSDVVGQTMQLGRVTATVVGVMPEGFRFPINHRMWAPLQLERSGYAPLDGPSIRVFGLVAPGATQAQANVEIATLTQQVKEASPATHRHFVPRVLAYGGESPGDRSILEIAITYLPIILVLVLACANVGTLVYARTATRDAEISVRYALGATRGRIITQLFVEALVLASVAAIVGLAVANWTLKWALTSYFAGQLPFWLNPGLKLSTVLFAIPLTVFSAAILGVLPALKATGKNAQAQLKNLGAGRIDAAIRQGLDRGDDRTGGAHRHPDSAGHGHLRGILARPRDPVEVPRRAIPRGRDRPGGRAKSRRGIGPGVHRPTRTHLPGDRAAQSRSNPKSPR